MRTVQKNFMIIEVTQMNFIISQMTLGISQLKINYVDGSQGQKSQNLKKYQNVRKS